MIGGSADTAFLRENAVRNFSMMQNSNRSMSRTRLVATIAIAWALGAGATMATAGVAEESTTPDSQTAAAPAPAAKTPGAKIKLDRSGPKPTGKASFYADRYAGKTIA